MHQPERDAAVPGLGGSPADGGPGPSSERDAHHDVRARPRSRRCGFGGAHHRRGDHRIRHGPPPRPAGGSRPTATDGQGRRALCRGSTDRCPPVGRRDARARDLRPPPRPRARPGGAGGEHSRDDDHRAVGPAQAPRRPPTPGVPSPRRGPRRGQRPRRTPGRARRRGGRARPGSRSPPIPPRRAPRSRGRTAPRRPRLAPSLPRPRGPRRGRAPGAGRPRATTRGHPRSSPRRRRP